MVFKVGLRTCTLPDAVAGPTAFSCFNVSMAFLILGSSEYALEVSSSTFNGGFSLTISVSLGRNLPL